MFVFVASSFWKRRVSDGHRSDDKTHVKDLKNIVEVQPPGDDRLLIFLYLQTPRGRIPFAPLGQPPLNICHRPGIESILVGGPRSVSPVPLTSSIRSSRHTRTD